LSFIRDFNSIQNDKQNNSFFQENFELIKLLPEDELNSSSNLISELLSSLSVINVHSEIARKLTLSNLIEIFAFKKERKLEFF
jgi:hypothetical protein